MSTLFKRKLNKIKGRYSGEITIIMVLFLLILLSTIMPVLDRFIPMVLVLMICAAIRGQTKFQCVNIKLTGIFFNTFLVCLALIYMNFNLSTTMGIGLIFLIVLAAIDLSN